MKYYREPNGDYLAIEPSTHYYYMVNFHKDEYEGRAAAIENDPSSVCTTGISQWYLDKCEKVKKGDVPKEWIDMF